MNKPEILWTSDDEGKLSTQIGPVRLVVGEVHYRQEWEVSMSTANGVVMHIETTGFWEAWKLAFAVREVVDYMNGDN